jgi:hypothetical protein
MGLDTSHDCWHGSYCAFTQWREALAVAAGYMIATIINDDGLKWTAVMVDWGHLQKNLMGKWPETPKDALLVLIAHSDCEGKIYPPQQLPLALRLKQLIPKLPKQKVQYKIATKKFIKGLCLAAGKNEIVDFH